MATQIISKEVDLWIMPAQTTTPQSAITQTTLGDLHSNALKLIFFLLHQSICTMTENNYDKLFLLYENAQLTKNSRHDFDILIDQKLKVINTNMLIRFIGNVFSDRGKNDYYALKNIHTLTENGVPIEILFSKQDANFILYYDSLKEAPQPRRLRISEDLTRSLVNLKKAIQSDVVTFNEVDAMVQRAYYPNIKLISASIDHPNNQMTLYSHAPIGLTQIQWAADYFQIPYNDDNILRLAEVIDNINQKFSKIIQAHALATLYTNNSFKRVDQNNATPDDIIMFIACNHHQTELHQPALHNGYHLMFVHGADMKKSKNPNVMNLNNYFGKMDKLTLGNLDVARTNEISLSQWQRSCVEAFIKKEPTGQKHQAPSQGLFSAKRFSSHTEVNASPKKSSIFSFFTTRKTPTLTPSPRSNGPEEDVVLLKQIG